MFENFRLGVKISTDSAVLSQSQRIDSKEIYFVLIDKTPFRCF